MAKKSASGSGTLRKKTVIRNGKTYSYWEGRVTTGTDPGSGKPIRRSFSGKTQKEVREKMQRASVELTDGVYIDPSKITVGEWLDVWTAEYLGGRKQSTIDAYKTKIRVHIAPALGHVQLQALTPAQIQKFYNDLQRSGMAPTTIRLIHAILHEALDKAVKIGYIYRNPSDNAELPRAEKTEIHPLDAKETADFLRAIQGHRFEALYTVTLFTGLREGEVLGLTWDCINFQDGTIHIYQQLQRSARKNEVALVPLKNDTPRTIAAAPSVIDVLKKRRAEQSRQHLEAGAAWISNNLVFTDELGRHLLAMTVYYSFKTVAKSIGRPDLRFHDLRHSYATAALACGTDIKTVQSTLGHASAAFTMDRYAHATDLMKQAGAERMENYIQNVKNF